MEEFKVVSETGTVLAVVRASQTTCTATAIGSLSVAEYVEKYFKTPRMFKVSGSSRFSFKRVTVLPTDSASFLLRAISELPAAIFEESSVKVHIER